MTTALNKMAPEAPSPDLTSVGLAVDALVAEKRAFAVIWPYLGKPRWFQNGAPRSQSYFWARTFSGLPGTGLWNNWEKQTQLFETHSPSGSFPQGQTPAFVIEPATDDEDFPSFRERVETVRTNISQSKVDKVVLSRTRTAQIRSGSVGAALAKLRPPTQGQTLFLMHQPNAGTFLGSSPEMLFAISGSEMQVDALAGTATTPGALAASQKDYVEHKFVCDAVKETLAPWLESIAVSTPTPVPRGELFHFHSSFKGRLRGHTEIFKLADALHPTPAVGISPRSKLPSLVDYESADRGYYAAPLGIVEENDEGSVDYAHVSVALRCALIREQTVTFFGGAGVVAESQAEKEWEETKLKMSNLEKAWSL